MYNSKEYNRQWFLKNKERIYKRRNELKKIYRQINPGWRISKECKKCKEMFTPNTHRQLYCSKKCRYVSRIKYKLSDKQWEQIDNGKENGICEVCGNKRKLCIDHDHTTGKFRGLLCICCNSALGFAKDNPEILKKLISYLASKTL